VKAREEEGDEAVPVRGSPELGRWRDGGGRRRRKALCRAGARVRARAQERWEEVRGGQGVELPFL
jgi:hypothetical protein